MRYALEELESRVLLNSAAIGPIATHVQPIVLQTTLFAPGTSLLSIPQNAGGPNVLYYRFALNSIDPTDPTQQAQFHLSPQIADGSSDAALALYDTNGNLVKSVDQDTDPSNPGDETLSANVANDRPYYLAAYFGPSGPPDDYQLQVTTPDQNIGRAIQPDSSTAIASFAATSPTDAFNGHADVHYYPITLLNEASGEHVTLTPEASGVAAAATLYRRDTHVDPWLPVASDQNILGNSVTIPIPAEDGKSLTDSQFMLAVAPAQFLGGPGAYQIDLSGATTLAPPAETVTAAPSPGSAAPISLTALGSTFNGNLPTGGEQQYLIRTPAIGGGQLTLTPSTFNGVISLYSADGSTLIGVASSTNGGNATLNFHSAIDTQYLVRVGSIGNTGSGAFQLAFAASLPVNGFFIGGNLSLTDPITTLSNIAIDANHSGHYYKLLSTGDADVLSIELDSATADTTMTLFGQTIGAVTQSAGRTSQHVDGEHRSRGRPAVDPLFRRHQR